MNPYIKEYNQYKANSVTTATPEQVLIMLYEGAIKFLLIAKKAIEEKRVQDTYENIMKTQRILRELMGSLDMDSGGEIAENLNRLYEYLHQQLVKANVKKDTALIDEVLRHLRSLKETWEQAIAIANKERKSSMIDSDNTDFTDRSA